VATCHSPRDACTGSLAGVEETTEEKGRDMSWELYIEEIVELVEMAEAVSMSEMAVAEREEVERLVP